MAATRPWHGVRLKIFEVGRDPDAPAHRVAVPAGWSEEAARGFVGLCCDDQPAGWPARRLPEEAASWIGRVIRRAVSLGSTRDPVEWAETLHCLLILRQGCPDRPIWRDEGQASFVLNAAAFADAETGLDRLCLEAAVDAAVAVLTTLSPGGPPAAGRPCLRIADLDGALARLGLAYDSQEGRDAARALVSLCRTTIAGAPVRLVVDAAGPAEALLGAETAGFAPAFSPLTADGRLTEAARARLAAQGLSAERALAQTLDGASPLRVPDEAAHAAMHDALAPLLDACPARPAAPPPRLVAASPVPQRRALPARSKGFTQKVSIGGHRLYLRTSEYADGTLGELSITLQGRDGTLSRGMADALSTAISTGLQHGVPLDRFVEAFAHTRFGASGTVEGDPSIGWASSPLDYAVRALAEAYLGRHLPDPAPTGEDEPASLPLGLDDGAPHASGGVRQRALRLVSPA